MRHRLSAWIVPALLGAACAAERSTSEPALALPATSTTPGLPEIRYYEIADT
jgi:hypothetical protein